MKKDIRIKAYYPNFFDDRAIAYVALRIVTYFNDVNVHSDVMGLSSARSFRAYKKYKNISSISRDTLPLRRRVYHDAIPSGLIWTIVNRIFSLRQIKTIAEWRFFHSLRKGDIAYLWPDASLKLYRRLHANGYLIINERINTLLATSKRILDTEYIALGLPIGHGLTDEAAEDELACMELSDYIFSPSPDVTSSILGAGISPSIIIESSYGLEEHEILPPPKPGSAGKAITALFVGSVCVRKGIHLLLKAWERADVRARLIIVGRVFPEVEGILKTALQAHPDIRHIDYVENLKPIYQDADFLILPSIEEGSPLVSYLALGASIPLVVSPMGAGGIIEDGIEGLIVDPHDEFELARAIRTLVTDDTLRARLGRAAGLKAPHYIWERVAIRRRELLFSRLHAIASMNLK